MIYLKLKKKPKTINEVIATLFANEGMSVKTYRDKECQQEQCKANKYRSADDIVELVRTYFPRATEKTIFKKLLDYRPKETYNLYLLSCSTIKKPTMCYVEASKVIFYRDFYDEGLTKSKYKNWAEICKMVGINSQMELQHKYNR